ncbi:MAG: hypothetical protein UMV23_05455 [Halanaerobium sp.]|nr:hypothetical protein [Halanaerobium sp.]
MKEWIRLGKLHQLWLVFLLFSLALTGCSNPVQDKANQVKTKPLQAFQLEQETRALFRSAFESYRNLSRIVYNEKEAEEGFAQIIWFLRDSLEEIAVDNEVDRIISRLKEVEKGGEGELTFPTHEVVKKVELLEDGVDEARVRFQVTRYYPAMEWSGAAYNKTFTYIVGMKLIDGRWKIKQLLEE